MTLILKTCLNALLKLLPALLQLLPGFIQLLRRNAPAPEAVHHGEADTGHDGDRKEVGVLQGGGDGEAGNSKPSNDGGEVVVETEVHRFLQWCHGKLGALYVWPTAANKYSGKDLPGALYKNVYDCSGFVTAGLYHATAGKTDLRATHNAQRLWDSCAPADGTGPCLAFYGLPKSKVTHVVVVLPDGRCIGSTRGDQTCTNPAIADARKARIVYHPHAGYRRDLRGFRKLPLKEK